jgi:hypothetical protein
VDPNVERAFREVGPVGRRQEGGALPRIHAPRIPRNPKEDVDE